MATSKKSARSTKAAKLVKAVEPDTRRTLTLPEIDRCRDEVEDAVRRNAKQWNSHGWAIVGTKRALRIEIAVAKTLLHPAYPIGPIELPSLGCSVKPAVRASLDGLSVATVAFPDDVAQTSTLLSSVTEPLAPGSRVFIDSQPTQRAGIACIVDVEGAPYLVTCGHVFQPRASATGVFTLGHKVAVLEHNFLEDGDQLDAAFCKITPKGQQLLARSAGAPTWLEGVLEPVSGQGRDAVFWPTNDAGGDAITTIIDSYSASESNLFNDFWSLSLSELIRTDQITVPGDSGSLLAIDGSFYGSCTGSPSWSYFTPLHVTLERMRDHLQKDVKLWQPITV